MNLLTLAIAPERSRTRLLMVNTAEQTEVMKAVLGPMAMGHPRAAPTLLEGLSLWHQAPLSVVLFVDEQASSFEHSLCDELGFGHRTLHYDVVIRGGRRRSPRLVGLGDFRDLRSACLEGGLR